MSKAFFHNFDGAPVRAPGHVHFSIITDFPHHPRRQPSEMTKSTPPTTLPGTLTTAPTTNGTPSSSIASLFADLAHVRATISTLQTSHSDEIKTLTAEIAALSAKNKALRDATYSPLARYERRLQFETRWRNFTCGTMVWFFAALYAAFYLFGPSWWCACVWVFLYVVSCLKTLESRWPGRRIRSLL